MSLFDPPPTGRDGLKLGLKTARCAACNAQVWMVWTDGTHKQAGIDLTPYDNGNVILTDQKTYRILTKNELQYGVKGPRYKTHFAVSPNCRKIAAPHQDPIKHR